jgi:hypothetical protein
MGLTTVVDPMIYRSADVFLRGADGFPEEHRAQYWRGLSANIGSLIAFFDALAFNEKLPMFNYVYTFPADLMNGRVALELACNKGCSRGEEVIIPVSVEHAAYRQAKEGAVAELMEIRARANLELRDEILQELSDLDYEWRPDLPAEEVVADALDNNEAKRERERELNFARFLLGGLIFGSYAQALGGEHVLQPKRSRLVLSAVMGTPGQYEDALLLKLRETARELEGKGLVFEIPARTAVLPYLLLNGEQNSARDLLNRALALRQTTGARRYRQLRREIDALLEAGRQPLEAMRILADAENEAKQLLRPRAARQGGLDFSATATVAGPELGVSSLRSLFGWFNDRMPWRQHFRLLQRLRGAEYQFRDVSVQIKAAWERPPSTADARPPIVLPIA